MRKKSFVGLPSIIIFLLVIKLLIHLLNIEYGYLRDELYYLAISDGFNFKNLEILPITPLYLKLMTSIFGISLKSIHFASSLLSAGAIIFACLIAKELGAGKFTIFFTGLTVLFSGYLIFGSLMTYDPIDFLLWAAAIYILVLILKYDKPKLWLLFGLITGIGLLNKLTIVFLGASVFAGLWLVPFRKHYKTIWIWLGGIIALTGAVPFIIWQFKYNWYYLEFAQNYAGGLSYIASFPEFLWNQMLPNNIINFPIWLTGLIFLFSKRFKTYRLFGYVYLIFFISCYTLGVKFYFMIPIYIILLTIGSIVIIRFLFKNNQKIKRTHLLKTIFIVIYICLSSVLIPLMIPILSPEKLEPYTKILGTDGSVKYEYNKLNQLPQHFADRFGWEEMVQDVKEVYMKSDAEKDELGIVAANWGQASALYVYAEKYTLPKPICLDGWFYFEAIKKKNFKENYITVGFTTKELEELFDTVKEKKIYRNQYCMPHENNKLIHYCSSPKSFLKSYIKVSRFIDQNFLKIAKRDGAEKAVNYYRKIKKITPDTLLFTERKINTLGYEFLNKGKIKEAKIIFQFNIDEFPTSSNTYDSMAEAYMENKEYDLSVKFYQKSLELNPENENAKQKLNELKTIQGK